MLFESYMLRSANFYFKSRRDYRKITYEHRTYESVDEKSLS